MKTLLTAILVLIAASALAGERECDVLQWRHDRPYFPLGEDDYVFPGYGYRIVCGGDTVMSGFIDESHLGMSFGEAVDSLGCFSLTDSCRAVVQVADVDSVSDITLGMQVIRGESSYRSFVGVSPPSWRYVGATETGNSVGLKPVSGPGFDLEIFFRNVDGVNSVKAVSARQEFSETVVLPNRDIAVLIPNLEKAINRDGFLTTSLYYRFDERRLDLYCEGDSLEPVNSFDRWNTEAARIFPYDPDKGRSLLEESDHRPESIAIAVEDKELEPLADYFADVLSRDRVRVTRANRSKDADVVLKIACGSDSPEKVLEWLRRDLIGTERATRAHSEALQLLDGYLEAAKARSDSAGQAYYYRKADRVLQDDLGVFPLFSPRVFFHHSPYLANVKFNATGAIDIEALVKLKPPTDSAVTER